MTNLNHRDGKIPDCICAVRYFKFINFNLTLLEKRGNMNVRKFINELIRTAKQEIKSYLPEEKRMWSRDDVQ